MYTFKTRGLKAKTGCVPLSQQGTCRKKTNQNKTLVTLWVFCFQSNAQSQVAPLTPQIVLTLISVRRLEYRRTVSTFHLFLGPLTPYCVPLGVESRASWDVWIGRVPRLPLASPDCGMGVYWSRERARAWMPATAITQHQGAASMELYAPQGKDASALRGGRNLATFFASPYLLKPFTLGRSVGFQTKYLMGGTTWPSCPVERYSGVRPAWIRRVLRSEAPLS